MNEDRIHHLSTVIADEQQPKQTRLSAIFELVGTPKSDDACLQLLDDHEPSGFPGRDIRHALLTHGNCVDALCVLLWSEDSAIRRAAVRRLRITKASTIGSDLGCLLANELAARPRDRDLIIQTLDTLGVCLPMNERPVPPAVVQAVADPDPTVRCIAAGVLRRVGLRDAVAGDALLLHLNDPQPAVRIAALELIAVLSPPQQAIPAIKALALADPDDLVRWVARYELSRHSIQLDEQHMPPQAA